MQLEEIHENLMRCGGPKEMVHNILRMEKEKVVICVAILWTWWKARNKINAGEDIFKPAEKVRNIHQCALEYKEYLLPGTTVKEIK
jgi:hypothetical protein